MKQIVIRVDSSTRMGTGHVMRCLTLAKKLKENNCHITFLCKQHNGHLNNFITASGFELISLSKPINNIDNEQDDKHWLGCHYQDDANECIQALAQRIDVPNIDLLIVDHYSLDYQWQAMLSLHCKKIMVIDDLANRKHLGDILLDQTYGRIKQDYQEYVPQKCQLLLGKPFILLRDEFYQSRAAAKKKRFNHTHKIQKKHNKVLISLGGTDPDNMASQILSWLIKKKKEKENCELSICLVASAASRFLDELQALAQVHPWITIITNPPSMSVLMLDATIAIGSSGATAWERCCMGLPTLSLICAANQQLVNSNLQAAGAIINLGWFSELTETVFNNALTTLLNDQQQYQKMVSHSFTCCDGLGVNKVVKSVMQTITTIALRQATLKDKEIVFQWQSDKNIRKYFKQPTTPTWAEHCHWFENNLSNSKSSLYLIYYDETAVGTLRLDEKKEHEYEVSILISISAQGKGIALAALNKIPQLKEHGLFFADIHHKNASSYHVFKKVGFSKISPYRFYLQIKANKKMI